MEDKLVSVLLGPPLFEKPASNDFATAWLYQLLRLNGTMTRKALSKRRTGWQNE